MNQNANEDYKDITVTDFNLLMDPLLNKGTAFSHQEREEFGLFGLIPPEESSLEQQLMRSYAAFTSKQSNLEKYMYMRDLQDSNTTLFYSLLGQHINEMMPIVYTPVVGEACQSFSRIYRRPRGVFIAYPYKDHIDTILANPRFDNVKVIVVSDGERILGLGDQGAGGMGIPIGKLSLYSACSGLHPSTLLPVLLDTGTNNKELIDDPLYIGWRHERIRGKDYDDFIDAFVQAVKKRFPHVVLQWEDFALQNATRLLERYQNQLCTFNDDVQGTAAVATGALLSAVQVTKIPLHEQKIVIMGAGSAGCGIAELIVHALIDDGLSETEARARIYMIDKNGLLLEGMPDLLPFQQKLLKSRAEVASWTCSNKSNPQLIDIIENIHPNALLGVSGQQGLFTEAVVRNMAAHVAMPIIMPLSNPITHSEATPADLMTWTENRAVIGTGSPFEPVIKNGKPFRVDQTNNVYIFPGMGMGLIVAKAKTVTPELFMVAAKALASCSPARDGIHENILPPVSEVRNVAYQVALAVAKKAVKSGLAEPMTDEEVEKTLKSMIWQPGYQPYRLKKL